jgi:hypothetical protein
MVDAEAWSDSLKNREPTRAALASTGTQHKWRSTFVARGPRKEVCPGAPWSRVQEKFPRVTGRRLTQHAP